MKYNLLGRTGLHVSAVSLGTVELGLPYGLPGNEMRPTVREAEHLLQHALDQGINHVDTARAYGDSEAIIGGVLGNRRPGVVLTTKVSGATVRLMQESVETSLRFLRTDCVDILMLHSAFEPAAAEHLLAFREKGYCRYVGASVYGPQAALVAIDSGLLDCVQLGYSPLDRRPEAEVFRRAELAGVGVIARSVLLKGALSPRYRNLPPSYADLCAAVARLEQLGLPLPELAYRYVRSQSQVATALAGTAHVAELDEILSYSEPLPEELSEAVRREPLLAEAWLHPGLWPSG